MEDEVDTEPGAVEVDRDAEVRAVEIPTEGLTADGSDTLTYESTAVELTAVIVRTDAGAGRA